jgi:hypothetical protein
VVAQLVEQRTENPRVVGSIPTLATIYLIDYKPLTSLSEWSHFPSAALSAVMPRDPEEMVPLLNF